MKIGVLALQGDFEAHAIVLSKLNVDFCFVTQPKQLSEIQGLILPGGESTTILKLLVEENFLKPLQDFAVAGGYLFGTCAGAILLAKEVTRPQQPSLNILDVTIERNAYGRQLSSHIDTGQLTFSKNESRDCEMVFIRAPKITRLGANVQAFAYQNDLPVGVIDGRCMITTFHPELSQDTSIHLYFVDQISSSL